MAKSAEEINELLATDLYRRAIKEKLITVNDDHTVIQYNCFNKTKSRLQNPEEFVQSKAFSTFTFISFLAIMVMLKNRKVAR